VIYLQKDIIYVMRQHIHDKNSAALTVCTRSWHLDIAPQWPRSTILPSTCTDADPEDNDFLLW